jgi:hypothetical protein
VAGTITVVPLNPHRSEGRKWLTFWLSFKTLGFLGLWLQEDDPFYLLLFVLFGWIWVRLWKRIWDES